MAAIVTAIATAPAAHSGPARSDHAERRHGRGRHDDGDGHEEPGGEHLAVRGATRSHEQDALMAAPGDGRRDHAQRPGGGTGRTDEGQGHGRLCRGQLAEVALEDGQQAGREAGHLRPLGLAAEGIGDAQCGEIVGDGRPRLSVGTPPVEDEAPRVPERATEPFGDGRAPARSR